MAPRVTVVIPNWNTRKFLEPCLNSLRRQTFRDFETILVDSASTDGSVGFVEAHFPEVKVVTLPENRGFSCEGYAGVGDSGSEFVALLINY